MSTEEVDVLDDGVPTPGQAFTFLLILGAVFMVILVCGGYAIRFVMDLIGG